MSFQQLDLGSYKVDVGVDDDGHLNIFVNSTDGSPVIETDVGLPDDGEFGVVLTTKQIEDDYRASHTSE